MKVIRTLSFILLAMMVMGCSEKKDTRQVQEFKESVYGYMYSAQSMASFIADNIGKYESGMHYFDTYNGYANYSTGEYCEDVKDMVAIIRNQYREQKSVDVIQSCASEARRLLPPDKPDLARLMKLAGEMEDLAVTSELTHTYGNKYKLLIEEFSTAFAVSDNTYPNTAVNYDSIQGGVIRLQETLMGL